MIFFLEFKSDLGTSALGICSHWPQAAALVTECGMLWRPRGQERQGTEVGP
jgi:hypothetical protein